MKKRLKAVTAAMSDRFFVFQSVLIIVFALLIGCESRKELLSQEVYNGPLVSMDSIFTKMSDSAKVLVRLRAVKQLNFEGGDREWPQNLYMEYLDDYGEIVSTFRADYVKYTSKDDLYRAEGNVIVRNIEDGDELNTEELFWNPATEEFYTERYVTIQSGDEIHTGEGMRADQDFSSYKILKPQGTILIEDETN